jgi:hypothetical protein
VHKRPYLRSLNLKTLLPYLQTLPIAGTAGAVPVLTGMKIDAVAPAIGPWLPPLTFLPEMNGRAHRVVVQSIRDLTAHPEQRNMIHRAGATATPGCAKAAFRRSSSSASW